MKELRFTLDIVPPKTTAQGKGIFICGGKPRFFTKARNKRDIEFLTAMLFPHRPPAPFIGALQVSIEWHFPYRAGERKGIVNSGVPIPHDCRPDLDNLEKSFLDCMTRLRFWEDDGQIAWKITRKLWSARPRIDVYIFDMTSAS
jgi:Holliday junction resolvase RusA-like endonuclease